ncbi:GNAT family N-acetyltransferase [Dongshaea marina]|uniref:GNAT family N-acetyltransferase n=1 Tax=Dongshaea marina TaxID=2047966 RepID=UPI000D3E6E7C|nr:GNAT family N-acetyltransferase [Dongshaea marina]
MNNSTIKIQQATLAQLDDVAILFDKYLQFYEQPADLGLCTQYIRQRMENSESVIFLATNAQGEALGFTQLYPMFCSVAAQRYYVLYDLYINEQARKQGVARALMEQAQLFAKQAGAYKLTLETAIDNLPAQKLYESIGYQRDTEFYSYALEL